MKYKIIGDSCLDLTAEMKKDPHYQMIPLTLMVGDRTFIDDETFDQKEFLRRVKESPNCPKSTCPSPERYMTAFEGEAQNVYAVTLSSRLSGSYNSARLGQQLFEEKHPDRKVHVFNSRSASIGQTLVAMKAEEYELAGCSFEERNSLWTVWIRISCWRVWRRCARTDACPVSRLLWHLR